MVKILASRDFGSMLCMLVSEQFLPFSNYFLVHKILKLVRLSWERGPYLGNFFLIFLLFRGMQKIDDHTQSILSSWMWAFLHSMGKSVTSFKIGGTHDPEQMKRPARWPKQSDWCIPVELWIKWDSHFLLPGRGRNSAPARQLNRAVGSSHHRCFAFPAPPSVPSVQNMHRYEATLARDHHLSTWAFLTSPNVSGQRWASLCLLLPKTHASNSTNEGVREFGVFLSQ